MATKLVKNRNGLALIIPQDVADRYHLASGVEVEITPTEDGILLQPIGVEPWFSIEWERALDAVLDRYRPALEEIGD